jgi:3-hydroxymyristoyl/3-hydroxydecanoyl-(acyl carrier protein) dehydratase
MAKIEGKAYVGEKLVAEATLSCFLIDRKAAKGGQE